MRYLLSLLLILSFSINCSAEVIYKITLRNKIGQMLLVGFEGKRVNAQSDIIKTIKKNNIGGVILFDYNSHTNTFNKNIKNPTQVKRLTHDLQSFAEKANKDQHRPNLPLLISIDYEGGKITRLSEQYGFPTTLSAADIGKKNRKDAENNSLLMARTLKKSGFNLNFAPDLDVNVNPNNPVIGKEDRSFSAQPSVVIQDAKIYSRNFLNQKIQCAYKHFPGHGSSNTDSHLGFVDVTNTWKPYELQPFQHLINTQDSCGMVMTAHIVNRQLDDSGLPATLSHKILTGVLRNQLHFKGVIITDDMQMKAISDHYGLEKSLTLAINAGADMFIFGGNLPGTAPSAEHIVDIIEAKVRSGAISQKRIDDAYQHIVALKKTLKTKL